jgi:hypothetical protein
MQQISQVATYHYYQQQLMMVIRLSTGTSTATTLAEGITQPTNRIYHPAEGRQHDNTVLAYSCDHQLPSTSDGIVLVVTLRNPKGTSPDLPLQKFNSHRV